MIGNYFHSNNVRSLADIKIPLLVANNFTPLIRTDLTCMDVQGRVKTRSHRANHVGKYVLVQDGAGGEHYSARVDEIKDGIEYLIVDWNNPATLEAKS